jgi:hypothetical protein
MFTITVPSLKNRDKMKDDVIAQLSDHYSHGFNSKNAVD